MFLKNTTIPTWWTDPNKVAEPSDVFAKPCDLPYAESCSTKRQTLSTLSVSLKYRTLNTEAFSLSFATENSLPLSKVLILVEFAKLVSKDVSALNCVKMDRAI